MTTFCAEFSHVTKSFRGQQAIRDLSLSVPPGSVFGL
jgi:ABC-type multidrug transport system ATPase subunit